MMDLAWPALMHGGCGQHLELEAELPDERMRRDDVFEHVEAAPVVVEFALYLNSAGAEQRGVQRRLRTQFATLVTLSAA